MILSFVYQHVVFKSSFPHWKLHLNIQPNIEVVNFACYKGHVMKVKVTVYNRFFLITMWIYIEI